jgi:hypothetical protein
MFFRYCLTVLLSCLVGFVTLFWVSNEYAQEEEEIDWRVELRQIDQEMKRAENLRNRYLAAAARAEDEGMRWQFQQNQKQEARRAFERAEMKKQAAAMLQAQIDALKARKQQILQEHPEANET